MRTLLLTGKWWVRHLLVLLAMAVCALLGRWQFDKGVFGHGDLVNLGYGVQWWSFAAIILYGWWRAARDVLHPDRRAAKAAATADRAALDRAALDGVTGGAAPASGAAPGAAAGPAVPESPAAPPGVPAAPPAAPAGAPRGGPDPVPLPATLFVGRRPLPAEEGEDPELAAYNAYLARLNARTR